MSTLIYRRNPFADFDALFRDAFRPVGSWPTTQAGFTPAAEIHREDADAVVRLDLPGVDVAKDVTVEVDGAMLVVRGERRDERTEDKDGRSTHEVRYGRFERTFRLPKHVSADAVQASYDAGVLTVRVVGAYAGSEAKQIEINAGHATVKAVEGAEKSDKDAA